MKTVIRKALALLLPCLLILSVPVPAFAAGGTDGDITWNYDEVSKTLTVGGVGPIKDYRLPSDSPWYAYADEATAIVIGPGVTGVGEKAFSYFTSAGSVSLPEGLEQIGDSAFYMCVALEAVSFPDSLKSIGLNAFMRCTSLKTVELPDGLETISGNAFNACALETVTIPNSVTSLGAQAFCSCSALSAVKLSENLTTMSQYAFANCPSLKSLRLPNGTQTVENGFCRYCPALRSVTIPDSVTLLDDRAFFDCDALETINFTGSEARWDAVAKGEYWLGLYDTGVEGNARDRTPEEMPGFRFHYGEQENLFWSYSETTKTLTVGGAGDMRDFRSVSNVPWNTYKGSAEALVIESGVTSVGAYAFARFTALKSAAIPEGVTKIGISGFDSCNALESVTLPDSLKSIGENAFLICSKLESVTIPYGVESIGRSAFGSCSALESLVLPDSVTSVGDLAFAACAALQSVTLSKNLKSIGFRTFFACISLQNVTIPGSVTSVGEDAFINCDGLQSVTLLDGVTTVGVNAFRYCHALKSMTIPKSVTGVGSYALENCEALETIRFTGSEAEWNAIQKGLYWLGVYNGNTTTHRELTPEEMPEIVFCCDLKDEAKDALTGYRNPNDYRENERAALAAAVDAGKGEIDAATDPDAVAAALANAKAVIDAIKTDAQLTAEETLAADTAAARAAEALIAAIGEVTYTDACRQKIEAAQNAVDALTPAQLALVDEEALETLFRAEETYARLKQKADHKSEFSPCELCGEIHDGFGWDMIVCTVHRIVYMVKTIAGWIAAAAA